MKELKVYVNDENMAIFACPVCERRTTNDISQFKEINSMVRIRCKCPCGNKYTAILERRKFYRKEVSLPGIYAKVGGQEQKSILIKNLSRSGVRFKGDETCQLNIGDKLDLSFELSDGHNTLIRKRVVVVTMSETDIGADFVSRDMNNPIDKAYELAIGFYTFRLN